MREVDTGITGKGVGLEHDGQYGRYINGCREIMLFSWWTQPRASSDWLMYLETCD